MTGDLPARPEDVEDLYKSAGKPSEWDEIMKQLAPGKSVRVGDSWPLDPKPITAAMEEGRFDLSKSAASAKLAKVYTKGKVRFGSFEVTAKFVFTEMTDDRLAATFDPPALYEIKGTVDVAIDGTSTETSRKAKQSLKGDGRWSAGGTTGRLLFDVAGDEEVNRSAESDDPVSQKVPAVTWLARPGEWVEFKPKDGKFEAKFPGTPTETSQVKEGVTQSQWVVKLDRAGVQFRIIATESPHLKKVDAKKRLDGLVDSIKGLKSRKDIEVSGLPGVDAIYEVEAEEFAFGVSRRILISSEQTFDLLVIAPKGKTAESEKFFDSFRVLKKLATKDD